MKTASKGFLGKVSWSYLEDGGWWSFKKGFSERSLGQGKWRFKEDFFQERGIL